MNEQISEKKPHNNWINKACSSLGQIEGVLCLIILTAVLCYGFWPILSAPNTNYPMTVDGMGHLTKVKYLADCVKDLNWPSWFPYWYNGSTVMQYYPPLSYILLIPVQILFDNIMITFKFYGIAFLLIGGMGVAYTCRRYIGPWVGILAAVIYVFNPFLTRSLFYQGVLAQGPVFAITPWFLYLTLLFFEKKSARYWAAIAITAALLILSHAMHAFIITLILGIIALVLLLNRSIKMTDLFLWCLAIMLGAGLDSYWWIPGVTQLETPGIPYLLPEAAEFWSAGIDWLTLQGRKGNWFYFGLSVLIIAIIPLFLSITKIVKKLILKKRSSNVKDLNNQKYLLALGIGFVASIIFSFGYKLPFFKYLPMHDNLVTGRILSLSACLAAILCAETLRLIASGRKKTYLGFNYRLFAVFVAFIILVDINPRMITFDSRPCQQQQSTLELIPASSDSFQNGRFAWVWPCISDMSYFPILHHLNMTDGWNIEGTPHNRTIWQHNVAIPGGCSDYVVRNLLSWNTRSAYIDNSYTQVIDGLTKNGFAILSKDASKSILFNPKPSSYFSLQERDALVLGKAALNFEMHFPWMVRGYSTFLEDYPSGYLNRFKLIYLIEPEFRDFIEFQSIIERLAAANKVVVVSMGREKTLPLWDICPYWETIESDSDLKPTGAGPIKREARIKADPTGQAPAIGNVDVLWSVMQGSGKNVPAIGYKNVNGHKVYFVGLALEQQLDSVYGEQLGMIFEELMDLAQPRKSIVPSAFPVKNQDWRYDGFSFGYDSQERTPVQISVTYTPRWEAMVDGKPWPVYNMENLIYMELPPGEHKVNFHYGMTRVGQLGIGLSIISCLMILALYIYYEKTDSILLMIKKHARKFIEKLDT